jgi:hypothetical protein
MAWRLSAAILALATLVAGCLGGSDPSAAPPAMTTSEIPPAKPAEFDSTTGGIEGRVHDDELLPVAGANVSLPLLRITARSDLDGAFAFSHVPPGVYELVAERSDYGRSSVFLEVKVGAVAQVQVLLSTTPIQEPFYNTAIQRGVVGCAVDVTAGSSLTGCTNFDPFFNLSAVFPDQYQIRWRLVGAVSEWKGASVEMEWRSTQTFGRSLWMLWDVLGCATGGEGEALADQAGRSPLHAFANATKVQDYWAIKRSGGCKDISKVCNDELGCKIDSLTFARAEPVTGGAPVGATFVWQQPFTQYFTDFYYVEGSPTFRAAPDG